MFWTIFGILLTVALLAGFIYFEYKWILHLYRSPIKRHNKFTKEAVLPSGFLGGLIVPTMEFFDAWMEPYIAGEGARFFLYLLCMVVIMVTIVRILMVLAKHQVKREGADFGTGCNAM